MFPLYSKAFEGAAAIYHQRVHQRVFGASYNTGSCHFIYGNVAVQHSVALIYISCRYYLWMLPRMHFFCPFIYL